MFVHPDLRACATAEDVSAGSTQMGDVRARSWIVAGTSLGGARPSFFAS
jgi:hypothetical protein